MASAFSLFGELKVETRGFELSLKRSTDQLKNTERRLESTERAAKRIGTSSAVASGGVDRLTASQRRAAASAQALGSALGTYAGLAVVAIGGFAVKTATSFDSLKRGLTAVTGSAAVMEQQMVRLKEVARSPGLGFKEAIQGSINLQAAGLQAVTAERALMAFGNALATVGKGKAELDGVITALSQIQSKGKVSAEEINQLAERLPQIRVAMQNAFGTADTEKLEKLGITSQQFIERVIGEFEKLPKAVGGAQDSFDNFKDTVERAIVPLGDAILKQLMPAMSELSAELEKDRPDMAAAAKGMGVRIGEMIGKGIVEGVKQLPNLTDEIINQMKPPSGGNFPIFMIFGKSLIESVYKGFKQVDGAAAWNELRQSWLFSLGAMGPALISKAFEIGKNVVQGLINGVKSLFGSLQSTMGELGSIAETAARARLDTRSPSKVFFAIGKDVAQGFIDGIASMNTSVYGAMIKMLDITGIKGLTKKDGKSVELLTELINELNQLIPKTVLQRMEAVRLSDAYKSGNVQIRKRIDLMIEEITRLTKLQEFYQAIQNRFGGGKLGESGDSEIGGEGSGRQENFILAGYNDLLQVMSGGNNPFDAIMDKLNPIPTLRPMWDNFWATMSERIDYFKSTLPSVKQALGENLLNSFYQIGDVLGNAVANWDGTLKGFFKSLAQGFRQLIGQLISELIKLMMYKLIFSILGGVAGGMGGGASGGASTGLGGAGGISGGAGLGGGGWGGVGGGMASGVSDLAAGFGGSSMMAPSAATSTYNQNVTVNMPSGSGGSITAEQVARVVISQLRRVEMKNK